MNLLLKRNVDEFFSSKFWRSVFAELLGTYILIGVGCGSGLADGVTKDFQMVRGCLSFVTLVASLIWIFGDVSGAHLNPSITLAQLLSRRIGALRAFFYVCVQVGGCTLGAISLKFIVNPERRGNLGITQLAKDMKEIQGVGVEICITFLVALMAFAISDKSRTDIDPKLAPVACAFSILGVILMAIPLTGASLNPARSFGPNIAYAKSSAWKSHWIYWVGPSVGAVAAAFIYDFILAPNASLKKIYKYLNDPDYNVHAFYDKQEITTEKNFKKSKPILLQEIYQKTPKEF